MAELRRVDEAVWRVLCRLGLHPTGEFGLGAAVAPTGADPGHVEVVLDRLRDLVREYAQERAAAAAERSAEKSSAAVSIPGPTRSTRR
ncbi:hypothetical protein [Saccharothrix sp. HUAS TT1]|uniref:hypothetical protein n=1 Tax=unclassified Saccharothrix TaxID=2593673 RepID=UPI00345C4DFC